MKRKAPRAPTVAIIGVGLIGASVGLAIRGAAPRTRVIGFDRNIAAVWDARRRGALSSIAQTLESAVATADVTVLAVPTPAIVKLLPRVVSSARARSLVIDVAGLKQPVFAAAERAINARQGVSVVCGHPLAGSERTGAQAADPALFRARPFALCAPRQVRRPAALRKAEAFVRRLGARPVRITALDHDRIVAVTSALPQLVASATALAATDVADRYRVLTGPGFASVTRLAATPAAVWEDALLTNKRNIISALAAFEARLRSFRRAIERDDGAALSRLLRMAAALQRRLRSS